VVMLRPSLMLGTHSTNAEFMGRGLAMESLNVR
jgi:hypothetical protein